MNGEEKAAKVRKTKNRKRRERKESEKLRNGVKMQKTGRCNLTNFTLEKRRKGRERKVTEGKERM